MRTKQDVQLELLKEIDEICEKNNLKYFLFSKNALNVYFNHSIKNGANVVCVAMTQGDIERFCEIVEKNSDGSRYVEGLFNNPRYNFNYVSYGDANTTDFQAVKLNYNKYHGIRIRIYPIKVSGVAPASIRREKKIRKIMNTRLINPKYWYIRAVTSILYGIYALLGCPKRYYQKVRNSKFINKFDDIQKHEYVAVGKNRIRSSSLASTTKFDVDGCQLCVPENFEAFLSDCYGESFMDKAVTANKQKLRNIIDTERSYEEVMAVSKDYIYQARCLHEEVLFSRLWLKKEKRTVAQVWRLVQMTKKHVEFLHYFEKNKERVLACDINDEKQFEALAEELKSVLWTLSKYSKFGMTFSIDPEVDAFLQKMLIKQDKALVVSRIKLIKNKKYYVK